MGSAAGLGVSTFGEDGFWASGRDGSGIADGMGASARADAPVSRATIATMAKVRMLASSPGHFAQSSLFQSTDLLDSETIQAGHWLTLPGSVSRVNPS